MTRNVRMLRLLALATLAVMLRAAKCYGQISADDVLKKYVAAVGGEAAIRSVHSRQLVGKVVTPGGEAPMEIIEAAPNKFLRIIDSPVSGRSENGLDGAVAWTRTDGGIQTVEGPPVGMMSRELALYRPIELATAYGSLKAPRSDSLDSRAVNVIEATSRDGMLEILYFDRESGLLSGWDVAIGGTTIRNRVDDYRLVDGIRIPFKVRRSRPDFSWSEVIDSVRHNVSTDDRRFSKPVGPSGQP